MQRECSDLVLCQCKQWNDPLQTYRNIGRLGNDLHNTWAQPDGMVSALGSRQSEGDNRYFFFCMLLVSVCIINENKAGILLSPLLQ